MSGAGFVKGKKNGNVISPEGSNSGSTVAEELSGDIEEADLNPEDIVVDELGEGRTKLREKREGEETLNINMDSLANDRISKFFTDSEIEELQAKEETVRGEDSPSSYQEAMEGIKRDCERHNQQVRERRKEVEIEKLKELTRDPKYDTPVKDLDGESFVELLNQGISGNSEPQEEELEKAIEAIEEEYSGSEPEINSPDSEVAELAANDWSDRNDVFAEFAEDISKSDEQTQYESVGPQSRRVSTQAEEMKIALRNPEKEENWNGSVEIEEDTGDTVVAVVSE